MKPAKELKVTYHESQEGLNRVLNIKISTLNAKHKDILRDFKHENGNSKPEQTVHLKLEDLIK